jgi:hypothetical protein
MLCEIQPEYTSMKRGRHWKRKRLEGHGDKIRMSSYGGGIIAERRQLLDSGVVRDCSSYPSASSAAHNHPEGA